MAQCWNQDRLRSLRVALSAADGTALLEALGGGPLEAVLQLAGDGVVAVATGRVPGAHAKAAEFLE